jgi:hypothetical protein
MEFNINQKFEFLSDLTSMVVNGITPSIIVTGPGGLGKTYSITKEIERNNLSPCEYTHIKGYSTSRGLYNALFDNNGKLIIFDDCDSVLEDKVAINILKSALDSYDVRKIHWMAKMNKNDDYPQSFEFTGRIIFISNKESSKIDSAILSRSIVIDLTMSQDEKIERMSHIIGYIMPDCPLDIKKDALDFLNKNKAQTNLNMRTLIMVSKIRYSYPDKWKNLANFMIKN